MKKTLDGEARLQWDVILYSGINELLDKALRGDINSLPVSVLDEMVQHYCDTVVISSAYLIKKLNELKRRSEKACI